MTENIVLPVDIGFNLYCNRNLIREYITEPFLDFDNRFNLYCNRNLIRESGLR